jgi:hypothetical protein
MHGVSANQAMRCATTGALWPHCIYKIAQILVKIAILILHRS